MADAAEMKARLRAQIAEIEAASASSRSAEVPPLSSVGKGGTRGRKHRTSEPLQNEDGNEAERLFRKIERLACNREQASVALHRRFLREGFPEEAIEQAIGRALACSLVDDMRYADVLVRSRLSQGKGRRGIAAELSDLGIDAHDVPAFESDERDDACEVERALALLDRKPPTSKNRREAAYRRLIQKGYSASSATTAARLWCEREDVPLSF